jgi:nicotinate-nucleotide adenylyltransferase
LGFLVPRRVGLLGGSFNPAHGGHRHISLEALKRLNLDQIWWLVSPHNPLKPVEGMAPAAQRMATARKEARDPRIKVLDLEARLGTRYTIDTIGALRRLYPRTRFVWLMGADNLGQIRRWRGWREIFRLVPVAVLDRPTYSLRALNELPAQFFRRRRVASAAARGLGDFAPPAWTFLPIRRDPRSASAVRAQTKQAVR